MNGVLDVTKPLKLRTYRLYWLDGTSEVVQGLTEAGAYRRAGYGSGAFSALDFIGRGRRQTHIWCVETRKWVRKEKHGTTNSRS